MSDNLIIPRQFVVDMRAAKIQQLRALKNEIAQYDRWLKMLPPDEQTVNNGVAFPGGPPPPLDKGDKWS